MDWRPWPCIVAQLARPFRNQRHTIRSDRVRYITIPIRRKLNGLGPDGSTLLRVSIGAIEGGDFIVKVIQFAFSSLSHSAYPVILPYFLFYRIEDGTFFRNFL